MLEACIPLFLGLLMAWALNKLGEIKTDPDCDVDTLVAAVNSGMLPFVVQEHETLLFSLGSDKDGTHRLAYTTTAWKGSPPGENLLYRDNGVVYTYKISNKDLKRLAEAVKNQSRGKLTDSLDKLREAKLEQAYKELTGG